MHFPLTTHNSNAVLIWNPTAGRDNKRRPRDIEAAKQALESAGIHVNIFQTNQPGEGAAVARKAVDNRADLIIVCGGDGTINDVLGGMVHSQVPLAVLPGGTANVLARELGLPLDIAAAARLIPESLPRRIALGNIGQRYFILMAGIGFDAQIVRNVNSQWKRLFGMASYIMTALHQLVRKPLHPFLLIDGNRRRNVTFACISRAQYYGPIRMIPEADLLSDQFYVYCFSSSNRLRYLFYTVALLTNLQGRLSDFNGFAAQEVRCEQLSVNGNKTFLQVDGEFAGELPCTISVVPDALTLLMPQGFAKTK